jgi:hypothetical protein
VRVVGAVQEVEVGMMRRRRRKESRALRRLSSSCPCSYVLMLPSYHDRYKTRNLDVYAPVLTPDSRFDGTLSLHTRLHR